MSKWKKIGSVHSGEDSKSNRSVRSRSRDQMHTMSFRQNVARMKINTSDLIDSDNTYFCKNYIDRKIQTSSNRSLSRIKTQKSLHNTENDIMRSTISKKRVSKDDDNQSRESVLEKTQQPKKLRQFAKQSQIKALKEDHLRLKQYVKYEIISFKSIFKDLQAELKYQIAYKRQFQAQKSKSESKIPTLVPIVPYRFDSKMLDSLNFLQQKDSKKNSHAKGREADINVLNQIKTQARLCIDQLNQLENQRTQILQKFKDINLEELLA